MRLKAPFFYFGGKSRVADEVWRRFGEVRNYVEPFCGSCAVLLGAPNPPRFETVNDLDGYVTNVWRAIAADPESVLHHCDWPVNELDLHARNGHMISRREEFTERLRADPEYYVARLAGWWLWGMANTIGRQWGRPNRSIPSLTRGNGVAVATPEELRALMTALSLRLREVRFACGDWRRVLTPTVTTKLGLTAVFLDPPYAAEKRGKVYVHDSYDLQEDVRKWAVENGENPQMRIALCGYREHDELKAKGWACHRWKAAGGYSKNKQDKRNGRFHETVWFSPHCLDGAQS